MSLAVHRSRCRLFEVELEGAARFIRERRKDRIQVARRIIFERFAARSGPVEGRRRQGTGTERSRYQLADKIPLVITFPDTAP